MCFTIIILCVSINALYYIEWPMHTLDVNAMCRPTDPTLTHHTEGESLAVARPPATQHQ